MRAELDLGMQAADALLAVQIATLTPQALALGVICTQQIIDRFMLANAQFMAAADRAGVWQGTGARDMADWLTNTTQTSYGTAKGLLELGAAADAAPEIAAAVAAGELSAASATTLHDAVTHAPAGADVGELVDAVKGAKPSAARKAAERWKEINSGTTESEEAREHRRYQKRSVRAGQPTDGMVTTTVTLPVAQWRQFMNAIHFVGGKPGQGDTRTTEQRLADGLTMLCDALAKGEVKGGRERPTMLLVFDIDAYLGETDTPARTANGDRIPACVARHIAENALLQRITQAGSKILDLSTTSRLASDDQYKALLLRDEGCRWPGCEIPAAWCEIDHLVPFPAGPTDLINLVLWCSHHHHEKHRPGIRVLGNAVNLRIQLPDGTILDCNQRRASAAA
ncbi:MAG TPA: HNH endonuclease signature motif containing protein [Ilumatobacteraceae bacterium]|nr:HNH endonuclease signature motif containing protein [Ilumatobacteraceae bacterium]HRB04012.1 HNH endonuclease signature motif containing protein [Ilumatobacteraceae bacterium]